MTVDLCSGSALFPRPPGHRLFSEVSVIVPCPFMQMPESYLDQGHHRILPSDTTCQDAENVVM
jgi:hypothetical protein